jgi:hypothetical protein
LKTAALELVLAALKRALDGAIRTENAAIARLRSEDGMAVDAFIKVEAPVLRDCFNLAVVAVRTGNQRVHETKVFRKMNSINRPKVLIPRRVFHSTPGTHPHRTSVL